MVDGNASFLHAFIGHSSNYFGVFTRETLMCFHTPKETIFARHLIAHDLLLLDKRCPSVRLAQACGHHYGSAMNPSLWNG